METSNSESHSRKQSQRRPWLETPLQAKSNEIRILKLHRGWKGDPIVCTLSIASLDDKPQYETLSYVWGDATKTRSIQVGCASFEATENLFNFMRCLRNRDADRFIWADAICIDQTSVEEKNHQLRLMARVYEQGAEAHVWFGYWTEDWAKEIVSEDQRYLRASQMTAGIWEQVERIAQDELRHFEEAGGEASTSPESSNSKEIYFKDILPQTLKILDAAAREVHLHQFPLFVANDKHQLVLNRHWLTILDCIRWMITRPWWSRVWTFQETILPQADPLVHTSQKPFRLSRLLNGLNAMMQHRMNCCKKLGRLFLAEYQHFSFGPYAHAMVLHDQRRDFFKPDSQGLDLGPAIGTSQGRNATDPRDHFFGILGLLPKVWSEGWFEEQNYSCSAAEIFGQCSKLLYTNDDNLQQLGDAIGVDKCKVDNLPSWAIDLSHSRRDSEDEGSDRWKLYNASKSSKYESVTFMHELAGPQLAVKGIRIGSVKCCASRGRSSYTSFQLLEHISEWRQIYHSSTETSDDNKFWRSAFMDRDIWRYWLHKRKPLPLNRLNDMKVWWKNWHTTKDSRDLTRDKQAGDGSRGDYHYRALKWNADRGRFFCTEKGEPGLGRHELQPMDEIFAIAGCNALAALRRIEGPEKDAFKFVGLCFVDGWMYGEALRGGALWREISLY